MTNDLCKKFVLIKTVIINVLFIACIVITSAYTQLPELHRTSTIHNIMYSIFFTLKVHIVFAQTEPYLLYLVH